ncbi:uncharacterized protein LOC132751539 [Ruditapes philippinarum]|uniref:uncharacterized protein LOC132751539 n=1 Tax=Ruditapes philippinarum TaxID=129788 RepID=UPI00295AF437|nr:uncharacterized protein LOC132751539 [Ruditapes philippinarum]
MDNKVVFVLLSCVCLVYGCSKKPIIHESSAQDMSISEEREKRFIKEGSHYRVQLQEDPCSFRTYDIDRDGTITQEELFVLLGTNRVTEALFNDLEIVREDGVITPEEFDSKVTSTILECITSD